MATTARLLPMETTTVKTILRFQCRVMSGSTERVRTLIMRGYKARIAAEIVRYELEFGCRNNPEAWAKADCNDEEFWRGFEKD